MLFMYPVDHESIPLYFGDYYCFDGLNELGRDDIYPRENAKMRTQRPWLGYDRTECSL